MTEQKNTEQKKTVSLHRNARKFRYGSLAILLTIAVIVIVILLNVVFGRLEQSRAWSIDVNALNATDFDPNTLEVLRLVDQDVYIYTVYQATSSSALRVQVDSILEKYHALNPHIHTGNIDPVGEPARILKLAGEKSLEEGAVIVTNADETRVKIYNRNDYFGTSSYGTYHFTYLYLERYITGALVYVTSETTPHVLFLSGHGEIPLESCTLLNQSLTTRNYDVGSLNISEGTDNLLPNDALIIADPARDLADEEYTFLRTWLSGGGRMLVCLSYDRDLTMLPNLMRLLEYYQLSYGDGVVYENNNSTDNYWNGNTLSLVPNLDPEHEITKRLIEIGSTNLVLPQARPILPPILPESGTTYTPLLTTSSRAYVVHDQETGNPGTQILALAMLDADENGEKEKDVRIVLVDTAYMLADSNLLYYSYNLNLVGTAVDWLINSDTTVDVSSKVMTNSTLSIPDSRTATGMGIAAIAVIPLCIIIPGIIIYIRRRRL